MQMQKKIKKWVLSIIICNLVVTSIPFSFPVTTTKMILAAETEDQGENKEDGEEKEEDTEKKEKEENKEEVIKPAISKTKVTIPINKVKPEQLSVLNPEEGVVYTFASSNKKIVTVGKKNGKLKGKKAGIARVSLLKKGKKKTTIVGICTVTVAKATISKKHQKMTASLNSTIVPAISYKNPKARYIYKSGNQNVVKVGEDIDDKGATSIVVKTLAEGKAVLTVKEKYKKKTTVVGKVTVTVKKPSLATQDIYMLKGQSLKIPNVVTINHEDTSQEVTYEYESSDTSVLSVIGERMTAIKATSGVNLDVYQNIDEKHTKLGTVVIVISEASNTLPEAVGDSNYVDLSDYNNDYEEGYDDYEDNDYYSIGSDYVEDETTDSDDSYDDYEKHLGEMEHFWDEDDEDEEME